MTWRYAPTRTFWGRFYISRNSVPADQLEQFDNITAHFGRKHKRNVVSFPATCSSLLKQHNVNGYLQ